MAADGDRRLEGAIPDLNLSLTTIAGGRCPVLAAVLGALRKAVIQR